MDKEELHDEEELHVEEESTTDAIPQEVIDEVKEQFEADVHEAAQEGAAIATDAIIEEVSDSVEEASEESAAAQEEPEVIEPVRAPEPVPAKQGLGQNAWIAIACAALVLGLLVGRFLLGGSGAAAAASLAGKTSVTEAELDKPIATVTYGGRTEDISIRDAILQGSSLEAVVDAEGNYQLPSADAAIAVARNLIIEREAENRGITVDDEALAKYAEQMLGSSDFASIAASYGMEEQAVIDLLRTSAITSQLHDDVVGTVTAVMPQAPTYPETAEGQEISEEDMTTPKAEYAEYIINLVGDEWDAKTGTWASTEGTYAVALAGYEITPEGATLEAAQAAYYVAYQLYAQSASAGSVQWNEFVNGLLSNADIHIYTLVS